MQYLEFRGLYSFWQRLMNIIAFREWFVQFFCSLGILIPRLCDLLSHTLTEISNYYSASLFTFCAKLWLHFRGRVIFLSSKNNYYFSKAKVVHMCFLVELYYEINEILCVYYSPAWLSVIKRLLEIREMYVNCGNNTATWHLGFQRKQTWVSSKLHPRDRTCFDLLTC